MATDSEQSVTDIGVQHVAEVYAQAFLGAAEKVGATEARLEELDAFIVQVLSRFPALEETLVSQFVSDDEKQGILDRVLTGRGCDDLLIFLKVVASHGRLDSLRMIRRAIHRQLDVLRGRREIEIRCASPVSEQVTTEIVSEVRRRLQIEPRAKVVTDPSLLGGVVITVGDMVYDGSLATQLKRMRRSIVDESIRQFQVNRDAYENGV